jgi:predicted metal-dependent hydrolase
VPQFKYRLNRSRRLLSNASISISPEKGVVVRAPFWMPQAVIDNFVNQKKEWILKHLNQIEKKKVIKKYENGEKHLFFGYEYPLEITAVSSPGRSAVQIVNDKFQIGIYEKLPEEERPARIKEALLHWYLEKGIETITEKVNYYSDKIGVSYARISLKQVSSIWGSCSPTNCLSFNRKLVMAPHEVVDYVVIHEVSHMVHRNHGRHFWELVGSFDPQYKNHRRWLKLNHHLLSI